MEEEKIKTITADLVAESKVDLIMERIGPLEISSIQEIKVQEVDLDMAHTPIGMVVVLVAVGMVQMQ